MGFGISTEQNVIKTIDHIIHYRDYMIRYVGHLFLLDIDIKSMDQIIDNFSF